MLYTLHMEKRKFTYIDLFAGIGGFHQAMKSLGGACLLAVDIDKSCQEMYLANYDVDEFKEDIRDINPSDIDNFDVLCAGFPCQPFSKAGSQKGFLDIGRGDLFFYILDFIDKHPEVKYLIIENVRNLADKSNHWNVIKNELLKRNFYITEDPLILSPTHFGIPQSRERVYILGVRKDIRNEKILINGYIHREDLHLDQYIETCKMNAAFSILEQNGFAKYQVPSDVELAINSWENFRKELGIKKIGWPIWINSFGLYELNESNFKYQIRFDEMPKWKQNFVSQNRNLYITNRKFIDRWINENSMLSKSKIYQKFEWNCGEDVNDIKGGIIQIRQSGIRVKRPTFFPSLVAIVNTPIVWDENLSHFRYITPREAANLQSFEKDTKFIGTDDKIYEQLGNSVNVQVIKILANNLFNLGKWEDISE